MGHARVCFLSPGFFVLGYVCFCRPKKQKAKKVENVEQSGFTQTVAFIRVDLGKKIQAEA